jgi:hypothetical protein
MSSDLLDRAEHDIEMADGLSAAARRITTDRDCVRMRVQRSKRRQASTRERAAVHDLTRIYRNGLR